MYRILFFGLLLLISSCKGAKDLVCQNVEGKQFISIISYNVEGGDTRDDREGIQAAFSREKRIYFPPGTYYLKSKTIDYAFLLWSDRSKVEEIVFAEGAVLKIHPNASTTYEKPSVIGIYANNGDVRKVSIRGINIDGNRENTKLKSTAILVYERAGYNVKRFIASDINIKEMGGGGIFAKALYNDLTNISTNNCGSHGIGSVNTTNFRQLHELYIDGYTSVNDGAYSIDFSGAENKSNRKLASSKDRWKGDVRNVKSIGSKYGIKTAGYWNLNLENIEIIDSENNGFYVSKDAPGMKVVVNNMNIKNVKGNGLYLGGETNFEGSNINIENCRVGLLVDKSKVEIDSITVSGGGISKVGFRISNNVSIENFEVSGITGDYPIWVTGTNVDLSNGKIYNNNTPYSMVITESASDVELSNLDLFDNRKTVIQKYGILSTQKSGETRFRNIKSLSKTFVKRGNAVLKKMEN